MNGCRYLTNIASYREKKGTWSLMINYEIRSKKKLIDYGIIRKRRRLCVIRIQSKVHFVGNSPKKISNRKYNISEVKFLNIFSKNKIIDTYFSLGPTTLIVFCDPACGKFWKNLKKMLKIVTLGLTLKKFKRNIKIIISMKIL